MLKVNDFKFHYTSERDNIYEDFYAPALKSAILYKRAVGYFSLGTLLNAPAALSELVGRAGKVRIIFAKIVSELDLKQIREGLEYKFEGNFPKFTEILNEHSDDLIEYRIRLLAYLFKTGQLEIKIALRRNGLFHQKIGVLRDAEGNVISFNGSMNETLSALDPNLNSEEITIFKSWEVGQRDYVTKHEEDFDKLWENRSSENTIVVDLPNALRRELDIISSDGAFTPSSAEERTRVKEFFEKMDHKKKFGPKVPKEINGKEFVIRQHQKLALNSWRDNGFQGILELATGTGKTITSIYALTRIAESVGGLSVIITVPYVNLADQWVDELKLFNIFAVKCYGNRAEWEPKLRSYLLRNQSSQKEFIALVVVNKTFKSEVFQKAILDLDWNKTMFIGDECHHHMSKGYNGILPKKAKYKLGLSATPFHYIDEEGNGRLKDFYGDVVYQYTLYEAIKNDVLTQYEYHPIPVILTPDETDKYFELSEKIGRMIATSSINPSDKDEHLQSILMQRARLIGTASNKLVELNKLITSVGVPTHSLFYCSDGKVSDEEDVFQDDDEPTEIKQRVAVAKLLRSRGISASFFTAEETASQRTSILQNFKSGEVSSLIAIRCLDEGIDVPACSTAFFLASSRNPRQFIQRRGRILRKSPGKDKAIIFDFVAVLPGGAIDNDEKESDFFRGELSRVADFAKYSINPISSLEALEYWLDKYDLHHLVV